VLGFPSGDFMEQGSPTKNPGILHAHLWREVRCSRRSIKGKDANPLLQRNCSDHRRSAEVELPQIPDGRDGRSVKAFGSRTAPDDKALVAAIEGALAVPATPAKAAR
jgi:glutathione peroxidase